LEQKTGLKHADILAITASSDEESKRQCIIAGCNGTLNKPIRKETLLKAIGRSMSLKKAA
jgi:CheY-like chemotaxis protein